MTSIRTHDPASGAVPPELPLMAISALATGLTDLLSDAWKLPEPGYITIHHSSQSIDLQFAPVKASVAALTSWALRFGTVLTSQPHDGKHGTETWCRVRFDYYDVAITAYACIPDDPDTT